VLIAKSARDRDVGKPLPEIRQTCGHRSCVGDGNRRDVMTHLLARRTLVSLVEHVLFILVGFVMMIVGLAMGVTMVMLPVGLVVGLIGVAMFVGGICVRSLDD
jgi:hypothetical protein